MWYMYIFLDIREELAFRNSPITRQSNPLNAAVNVGAIILTKLFTHCVMMSLRLPPGDRSSFLCLTEKNFKMVYHFVCVGTTNNNSTIVRKVVSKTVINCGCAF